jgi:hypothetical protein
MADETLAAAPIAGDAAARIEHAIATWLAEHIHNSPVSRATEAFHHLLAALEHLKARLLKEV